MWGRVALWAVSLIAIPVAQYVWKQIMEPPKYWVELDPDNTTKEKETK